MNNHIFSLIEQEQYRQEKSIDLIASENYASAAVMQATGSVLTNKYAEGYPGKRYYGGCQVIDEIENYTIELGKKLFKTDHINVQPHSGASANFSIYLALLNPGDTVLAMNLAAGGHLTHGHKVNFSGKLYKFIHYGVDPETEQINYEQVQQLATEHKPKLIIAGASAYARLMDYQKLATIAQSVSSDAKAMEDRSALLMVDMAHLSGLVAADVIPSPIPWADVVSSTTHKTLRGPRGGIICSKQTLAATIDKAVMPGHQGGPLMHVIAAKGIAFEEALQPSFKHYAQQILRNAQVMAKTFQSLGYRLVAGGTDTHLLLVDLRSVKNQVVTGKEIEELLGRCGIVVNRNTIPFDPQSANLTSGLRVGTPAITTRGFREAQTEQVVVWIDEAIRNRHDEAFIKRLKIEVEKLCAQYPVYKK